MVPEETGLLLCTRPVALVWEKYAVNIGGVDGKVGHLGYPEGNHGAPLLADCLLHITSGLSHLSGSFLCSYLRGSTSISVPCNVLTHCS